MHGQNDRTDEAFDLLNKALEHIEETDEHYYEAEIHRLCGEMELRRGGDGAVAAGDRPASPPGAGTRRS